MTLTIKMECDNAAFDRAPGFEVARILRELADKFQENDPIDPGYFGPVKDINGNRVGSFTFDK